MGKLCLQQRVILAAIEDKFIMKINILQQQSLTFDRKNDILRIEIEEFILSTRKYVTARVCLFANRRPTVKPNSKEILEARMETILESLVRIIERTSGSPKNLLVARTLVND